MSPNSSIPPWWRPDQFARRKAALDIRQRVVRVMRNYFEAQGFDEVETPALQISPGNEIHLHAFATQFVGLFDGGRKNYYLHTSPEFSMKKLLVAGASKIFQLAHVFRNGERSSRHHPEFSMLEWYRAHVNLDAIKQDCVNLVRAAAKASNVLKFSAQGMDCDPFLEWESLSVADAFQRYTGIDLAAALNDLDNFRAQVLRAGTGASIEDSWDDLFFRVMGEKIEPFLGKDRPCFLCDYPASMAALARKKRDDPRWAERFELYICGYELANAFDELTDAEEQACRFEADMEAKQKFYGEKYPIDHDFLAALRHGMPDSAGIALGFDRLVMLCAGVEDIEATLWAPVN